MDPLTATISADPLGVLVAFGAGILSFVSPCVLPLVPGYVSMVSGLSAAELSATRAQAPSRGRATSAPPDLGAVASPSASAGPTTIPPANTPTTPTTTTTSAATTAPFAPAARIALADPGAPVALADPEAPVALADPRAPSPASPASPASPPPVAVTMRPVLRGIGLFIAGFTIVFVALGAAASGIGRLLVSHKETLTHVSGFVVIVLGLVLLLGALPAGFWSRVGAGPRGVLTRMTGQRRFDVRPSTLGTWAAPVMGMAFAFAWTPCIGPVLAVVLGLAEHNGSLAGGVLLLFAYSLGLAVPFLLAGLAFGRLTSAIARARRGLWLVEAVGGTVLVVFGVLLVTDHLGWISTQFTTLLDHIGLKRLSTS
jgi:cytochrome c-type biogenesis protein